MPACTYSASAEIRSPLAICCKISALGLRRPRSIWLRYGLDTPAAEESCRSEILACSRCWRMYSPMEPTFTGLTPTVNQRLLAIANAQQAPRIVAGLRRHLAPYPDRAFHTKWLHKPGHTGT